MKAGAKILGNHLIEEIVERADGRICDEICSSVISSLTGLMPSNALKMASLFYNCII